jgi:putative transposase
MYLRTTKRTNKDGSVVEYFQIAHNERHPKTRKPVAKIIHNFGRADQLDRLELVRLCRSIARVCGLHISDPLAEDVLLPEGEAIGIPPDLKIKQTFALGCPLVIEALWERLGLKKTLNSIEQAPTDRAQNAGGRELSALMPARRCDRGCSRTVDDETRGALIRLRKEQPGWPVWRLVQALAEKQVITPGTTLSLSTAYRILTQEKLDSAALHKRAPVDRRRYEAEFPNDIWQSDIMHGPLVKGTGKRRKAYLIAILDDHSRFITHGEFFSSEKLESWLQVFRQALLTRGLPRKLYVDNGAAFRSRHLERICASLGIALIHSRPYTPQGRGKIERFFRTVRSRFISRLDDQPDTLAQLNERFQHWLETDYLHRVHSVTAMTPFNRFAAHLEMIREAPADLTDHFRKEVRRRVSKDRVVTIDGRLFEAPVQLIGERVTLLFNDDRPERVEIFCKGQSCGLLRPVDLVVNTLVKRTKNGGEEMLAETSTCRPGRLPFDPSADGGGS